MKIHAPLIASLSVLLLVGSLPNAHASNGPQPAQGQGVAKGPPQPLMAMTSVSDLPIIQQSNRLGHADGSQPLYVSVGLHPADSAAMEAFAESVSAPGSPNFRKFITPEEVGARFGLPSERVQAVADYLSSKGIAVTLIAKNRLSILCEGTVSQFEAAFNTTIDRYHVDPVLVPGEKGGNPDFIAPSTPIMAPVGIAGDILDVFGLETYTKPKPRAALTPSQTRILYNSAPIYLGGMRGEGRAIGVSNFDGYLLSNINLYYSHYSLPSPVGGVGSNVHVVTISGGGASGASGEGDLDMQMVLGMAPLCDLYIYDSSTNLIGTLTKEANDNTADIITESYGWNLTTSAANSAHNQHVAMTTQGITYMCASGDDGTTIEPFSYPNYDPEVLVVGGTVATVNAGGLRLSEVGWSGSGGGWSTKAVSWNVRPSWQTGTGVNTSINFRMGPDLSLHASGAASGAYGYYFNGSLDLNSIGTSFSSPVLAGMIGIGEQKLISLGGLPANGAGKRRFGRMQNVIYAQDGLTSVWYDITSGSNGTLPNGSASNCTAKFDMVTGWGAMNVYAFINSQAPPPCPADLNGDHLVDGGDLGILLGQWGGAGTADLNHDGIVDGADLGALLGAWGNCPS